MGPSVDRFPHIPCFSFSLKYLDNSVCMLSHFSHVQLFATLWIVAHQAPLSMGILQARTLEWVAMPSSRGSSQPRDQICIPHAFCIGRWVLSTHSSTLAWQIPWAEEPGRLQSMGSESDKTERLHFHFSLSCIGEENGNPLQCSSLENPRDGGAWWVAIYGVA